MTRLTRWIGLVALCLGATLATAAETATVLITGANRGIGLEYARQFEAKGYTVIGTARNPGAGEWNWPRWASGSKPWT